MKTLTKTEILSQIAQIKLMERGKLAACAFKDRSPDAPPHFKLQRWEHGKNHTQHVTQEQLPLLKDALAGFAKFQELTTQLSQLVMTETRQQLRQVRTGAKKKTRPPLSCWPKTRKSNA
jgi:hypothetical protein